MTTKITAANLVTNAITATQLGDTIAADRVNAALLAPTITSISYGTQTAADPNAAYTVTITGTGFDSTTQVMINDQLCSSVTYVSSTLLQAVTPLLSAGNYDLMINNGASQFCLKKNFVSVDMGPSWITPAGILSTVVEGTEASISVVPVVATSNSAVTYSFGSGILPPGTRFDNDTGRLTGTVFRIEPMSPTTFYFSLNAIDAENQTTSRTFGVTVMPEIITWAEPAQNSTITAFFYIAISQNLFASSSLGNAITYSAVNLPPGITINGNVISGAATAAGTTVATIYATSSTGRAFTRTLNFVIQSTTSWAVDALIIAGGGSGGGFAISGGGGAGGFLTATVFGVATASYTVTIGAGGAFAPNSTPGNPGTNSVLGSNIAITGGAGGRPGLPGQDGGSGGGGGGSGGAGGAGTVGPPRQGYNGASITTFAYAGGGGGGGGVGVEKVGGIGAISNITGSAVFYAGGGGGGGYSTYAAAGAGGEGGGGAGSVAGGGAGTPNTGGGGGGGGRNVGSDIFASGGAGGSGIVIIAYPDTNPPLTSITAGLTYNQPTRPGFRVYRFTAGTGIITW